MELLSWVNRMNSKRQFCWSYQFWKLPPPRYIGGSTTKYAVFWHVRMWTNAYQKIFDPQGVVLLDARVCVCVRRIYAVWICLNGISRRMYFHAESRVYSVVIKLRLWMPNVDATPHSRCTRWFIKPYIFHVDAWMPLSSLLSVNMNSSVDAVRCYRIAVITIRRWTRDVWPKRRNEIFTKIVFNRCVQIEQQRSNVFPIQQSGWSLLFSVFRFRENDGIFSIELVALIFINNFECVN